MGITKKIRFEVFKRDFFTCQYCGQTPPMAILEVDHIKPKSKNGKDEIDNLTTSCFECNRGKGKNELNCIPDAIYDKSKILKEKEEQLMEYNKILEEARNRKILNINTFCCILINMFFYARV